MSHSARSSLSFQASTDRLLPLSGLGRAGSGGSDEDMEEMAEVPLRPRWRSTSVGSPAWRSSRHHHHPPSLGAGDGLRFLCGSRQRSIFLLTLALAAVVSYCLGAASASAGLFSGPAADRCALSPYGIMLRGMGRGGWRRKHGRGRGGHAHRNSTTAGGGGRWWDKATEAFSGGRARPSSALASVQGGRFANPYPPDADELVFPGDGTRDLLPIKAHSHNDYWRDIPLYSALQHGLLSVEADVWRIERGVGSDRYNESIGDTLYVGHGRSYLTPSRTFDGLYISQIVKLLEEVNPPDSAGDDSRPWNGIYASDPSATLHLLVDLKTDGPTTLPFVWRALQPLRERGWLSTWNASHGFVPGPITVIGTGNTPVHLIVDPHLYSPSSTRDIFYDAPLNAISDGYTAADGTHREYDSTVSPIASASFLRYVGWMALFEAGAGVLERTKMYVDAAHERGIETRWWDTPGWPRFARHRVWKTLLRLDVDWLNVDDLDDAVRF